MKRRYRVLMLVVLLGLAMLSYAVGFSRGLILVVMVGMVIELLFWLKTFEQLPEQLRETGSRPKDSQ